MEEKTKSTEKARSFSEIMLVIRKQIVWIVLIIVACIACGAVYIVLFQKTTYTASVLVTAQAKEYQTDKPTNTPDNHTEYYAQTTSYQFSVMLAKEYQKILTTREVVDYAVNEKDVNLTGAISFAYTEESPVFRIFCSTSIHDGDEKQIKKELVEGLNHYLDASLEYINNYDEEHVGEIDADKYWFYQNNLKIVSKAYEDNVAMSTTKTRTMLLAVAIGLILALAYIFIIYFIDDTVNSKEDIENIMDSSVIAFIDLSYNQANQTAVVKNTAGADSKEA